MTHTKFHTGGARGDAGTALDTEDTAPVKPPTPACGCRKWQNQQVLPFDVEQSFLELILKSLVRNV